LLLQPVALVAVAVAMLALHQAKMQVQRLPLVQIAVVLGKTVKEKPETVVAVVAVVAESLAECLADYAAVTKVL
jgi:hypothetical protein